MLTMNMCQPNENTMPFAMLMTEIKEDLSKWRNISCSWIGRLHNVKVSILPKLAYQFNAIPIKVSARIFVGVDKLIPKLIWKGKELKITKSILKKE